MKIGLTYDLEQDYLGLGFSEEDAAEFDCIETIDAIDEALQSLGYQTERIGNIKSLVPMLAQGKRWDLVFNIAEGAYGMGRESQVPCVLDAYQIPYTFSDPSVLALCLNKGLTQRVVRSCGIRAADFCVIERLADVKKVDLKFPLFVKPVCEGTGKGISKNSRVENLAELTSTCKSLLSKYHQPLLVERYLPGREFTVGVIGTGRDAEAVGVMEVHLKEGAECGCYGYYNKKNWKKVVSYSRTRGQIAAECKALAIAAWKALGCRDAGRIDIRLDDEGQPCFMEVNPLAGIRPGYSDFCILNDFVGLSHREFIGRIVKSAMSRCGLSSVEGAVVNASGEGIVHRRSA